MSNTITGSNTTLVTAANKALLLQWAKHDNAIIRLYKHRNGEYPTLVGEDEAKTVLGQFFKGDEVHYAELEYFFNNGFSYLLMFERTN